jgi:putative PIG3 family NAD(P)H quinone oxidoreductase
MIAIEISQPGEPDVLVPVERPRPEPAAGEVLIKVAAAGVNRPDVMQRRGRYPPPPGASDIPGLEVSGRIDAVGSGVARFAVGDAVCALVSGGGYTEYCVAPAPQCLPAPRNLELTHAAGIPETFFTVWTNLFERGRLARGETALIHGGSSGIGTTAIQIAHARGARVFATAGSAEKCRACERLGAAKAINYREADFVQAVRDLTGGKGVDVVLDMIAGDYVARNIETLAVEGRLVQIATQQGAKVEINVMTVMQKRLTITGSTLRPRSSLEKGAIAAAVHEQVWPLIESGDVKPIVFATFPLREAAAAHRLMESSTHIGKILLVTDAA